MLVSLGYPAQDPEAGTTRTGSSPVDEIVHVDEFAPGARTESAAPGDD